MSICVDARYNLVEVTDDWHCVATPNEGWKSIFCSYRESYKYKYVAVRENYFHLVFCILNTYVVFCCTEKFCVK